MADIVIGDFALSKFHVALQDTPSISYTLTIYDIDEDDASDTFMCLSSLRIVNNANSDIEHYCKYSPFSDNCTPVWIGCGAEMNVDEEDVEFWSMNYPNGPADSPCAYKFYPAFGKRLVDGVKYCPTTPSGLMGIQSSEAVNVTLVSLSDSPGGFHLTVKSGIKNVSSNVRMNISFTWIESGCVTVKSGDSTNLTQVCQTDDVSTYTFENNIVVESEIRFTAEYVFEIYYVPAQSFTYEISLDGNTPGAGLVYFTRSDGYRGYLCYYIYADEAETICRKAGYGSYVSYSNYAYATGNGEDAGAVSYFNCFGSSCTITWVDSCSSCACRGTPFQAVTCFILD
ncbi:hypothetical protein MAR_027529 [Mya arenaria]|uniref:Egg coat matrix protein n=1 Tax=Mya arenaria TaxID=6604 RepID=A0ABY7EW60_MYAAR|nr:hypothetical protein MAR_027529 [Mya arenaria]